MSKMDFKPAWWLRSPHLQTLWPVIFKRRHKLDLEYEQVELPDGDFLELLWSRKSSGRIVIVLHGLEGSLDSHYANGIMYQLENAGFRPVFMYFRGCSGRINRLPRAYHSGDTGDISYISQHIHHRKGEAPYAAVGYSLGGNVLLKWLGETAAENPLNKAVAVSVPYRLGDAADRLESGVSRIYRDHLLSSLRRTYRKKFSTMASPLQVDVSRLRSFREYDDKVTAPLHGFDGADDYYRRCSSRQFLQHISVPTRLLHAADDPFMFPDTLPDREELSRDVELIVSDHGGHVGFIASCHGFGTCSWSEQMIMEFLR